jgi:hypothetical protein
VRERERERLESHADARRNGVSFPSGV